jgi:hypothetical protein
MGCRLQFQGLALVTALLAVAQGPDQQTTANLEFRLQPEAILQGVPLAFRFLLVNNTGRNVRVPVPSFNCEDAYGGSISLRLHFTPLVPEPFTAFNCSGDGPFGVPITDRIKEWQIVAPGYALSLKVDRKHIAWAVVRRDGPLPNAEEHVVQPGMTPYFYDDSKPGTYEFWAIYTPPFVDTSDQRKLHEVGIDYPHAKLTTAHVTFVRDQ